MNRLTKFALVAAAASLVCSLHAFASTNASDNASNSPPYTSGTWNTTTNGGTGFGAWSFAPAGDGGSYIGLTGLSSTSFAVYAGADGSGNSGTALRQFLGGGLAVGQTFSVELGVGPATSNPVDAGGNVGLSLFSGATPEFTVEYVPNNSTFWELNDGGSDFPTTQAFAANTPLLFSFTYNGGSSYSYTLGSATGTNSATATISDLTAVNFFSTGQGPNGNFGFNNLSIVPEPSTLMMVMSSGLCGSFYLRRRRRK